ncbi:hypothetical protein [Micromonospora sp. RTGN7]|uniref:hypothetical protein n=1 Tax=Micromonospora sp. RTGN7 TaxID=3016526 RepID=UPI0029FEFF39|nr:hypothetical protein [Micromonospora sp. RTGN7]
MFSRNWDFGPIGNAAWRHFPEARESIKELVCGELDRAIDADRHPDPVEHCEYAVHGVGPLLSAGRVVGDLDPDLVRRFCLFCRDVLDHCGPDDVNVSYTFNMYILDAVDDPASVRTLRGVDSELVDLVHARYPGTWIEDD